MRKNVLSFLMMAAALVGAVSSCTDPNDDINGGGEQTVTVYATLENQKEWNAGDEVVINGSSYVVTEGNTSTVSIEGVTKADSYHAAYNFGNGSLEGTNLTLTVPQSQGEGVSVIEPMVASNKNPNLVFKHLLGGLTLNIEGEGKIVRAVVSSVDQSIAGSGVVNLNFVGSPVLNIADSGSKSITYNCGSNGLSLPAEVTIALPAKSYTGFIVTLYGANDEIMVGGELSNVEILRGENVAKTVTYDPNTTPSTYVTATVENDANGNAYTWSSNSTIYVNGIPALLAGGEGTTSGEFGPVTKADLYLASTSSSSANGVSGNTMRISIPTTQGHNDALSLLNPAVAKSNNENLTFTYLAGVVNVNISGPYMLRKATLAGKNNRRLSGSGVVDMATATPRLALGSDASKTVVADFGAAGINIEGGATLRFVIPAEDYSADGFTLTLDAVTGQTYSMEIEGINVQRNAIATLPAIVWESSQDDSNNLSKLGYANCYMIHNAGDYSFKTRLVDNTPINNIAKVDWLWVSTVAGQSGNALISNIKYENGTVTFTASAHEGNALLAAFDEAGNIVWSWHIWMTDKPEVYDFQNNSIPQSGGLTDGYYCMDRNLGATDATALGGYETFGLYYQWGRKDPFIGDKQEERSRDNENGGWKENVKTFGNSGSLTVCNTAYAQAKWVTTPTNSTIGTIAYATANPMTFLYSGTGNVANWLDVKGLSSAEKNNICYDPDKSLWRPFQKSNYDPCPVGYQVPRKAMWVALGANAVVTDYKGFVETTDAGAESWFPMAGYRSAHPSDTGSLMSVQNKNGFVELWSSELEVSETAYHFFYSNPTFYAGNGAGWGNGYNVRCVKIYE